MANIEIRKVETKKDLTKFIDLHYDLYEGNEYDAPCLFADEMNTLSQDKNPAFEFCKAEYYMCYKDGKLVGRVAAIINEKANKTWDRKDVRFGWIDYIDDLEVVDALMNAVADFGRRNGMNQVVGPLGFTDFDPEGMLTYGFDQLGTMATSYNYEYYPKYFEQNGWEVDNIYIENKVYVPKEIPEKFAKIGAMIQKRYNLQIKKFTKKEVTKDGWGYKIFDLLNDAYKHLYGYNELSPRQTDEYIKTYLKLLDLEMVTGVIDGNTGEIVGIAITMASLSRALQKCRRGRLFPFGWWHIIRALYFHKTKIADLLLIGVKPEYRSKGANALIFTDLIPIYQKYGWEWGETHVEMLTNKNVQSQWEYLEHEVHKRRKCYKKSL